MVQIYGYEYKPAAHLSASDEDAADFLQSQFSNDLRPFEAGQCTYGLWLDVKGKVVADSTVLYDGNERFRIISEHSLPATIAEKLERHIIADDVIIEQLPQGYAIALVGDGLTELLDSIGIQAPGDGTFREIDSLSIYKGRRSLKPSFECWSESEEAISDLKARLVQAGVTFVSEPSIERMRLEAGTPRIPMEVGAGDLPGEGDLVGDAVSIDKGCYLGQEVVARMHNLGRAQRMLFLMSGSGEAPCCPVPLYNDAAKQVGELRSAFSSGESGWKGVALLKLRYTEVGKSLSYSSGSVKVERLFRSV